LKQAIRRLLRAWREKDHAARARLVTLVLFLPILVIFKVLSNDQRYLDVSAEAESLLYRVSRPELASVPLLGARVQNQPQCVSALGESINSNFIGIVRPNEGTLVRYRWSVERVSISLTATERLTEVEPGTQTIQQPADPSEQQPQSSAGQLIVSGQMCDLQSTAVLVLPVTPDNVRPLPIAGHMEIGVAFGVPLEPRVGASMHTGIMYGAEVRVFGRSLLSDRLFPIYDSPISIPAGGTLSTIEFSNDENSHGRISNNDHGWYGIAEIGQKSFEISATVQTSDLIFTRAGSTREQERLAVSFLTEVVRDPDLSELLLWIGVIVFLFQIVVAAYSITGKRDEPV